MTKLWEKIKAALKLLGELWRNRHLLNERRLPTALKNFLPPALEVMEKPPHPLPRVLLFVIGAICLFGLLWAILGKVDVITVAEGKIIPNGQVKAIQSYDRGVVSRIMVLEGQLVAAGRPLIELDRTQTSAEEARLLAESLFAADKQTRRLILVELLARPAGEIITAEEIQSHPKLGGDREKGRQLGEEYTTVMAQWRTLEAQLEERRAEWAGSQEVIKQLSATLPLIEQRLAAYENLYEKQLVGINEYLALKDDRLRQFHGLEAEKSRAVQLAAAIRSMERQIEARKAQSRSELLNELDDLNRQNEALRQELDKVRDLSPKQILYSPVQGTVKNLVTHTVGGVVEPAQVLMELVPLGERLEVEAFVSNQDIGYVRAGQRAEVKIATFPFTKYGVIEATVDQVAEDATVDEKLGLIYRTRLLLAKNSLRVNGRETPVLPGMAVTAEIATDQRRLIEFFLAPLLRMKDESLRER
jgi:hemolysin D